MDRCQRVLIYGNAQEYRDAFKLLNANPPFAGTNFEYTHVASHDDFRVQLVERDPALAIVLADGVAGMEGVYLVRESRPATAVFWFSDDRDFCMQSHRLECAYFSTKPLTAEKIRKAFYQCAHLGIRLGNR